MPTAILVVSLAMVVVPPQVSRRPSGGAAQPATVSAAIALRAGAAQYDFKGQAQCRHAPQASIYGTPAEMWSIQQNASGQRLTLTVWKPRTGDPMLNLAVSSGGKDYRVNTVTSGGQEPTGSGSVTFAQEGKGGTFTIAAVAENGSKISGTVTCDAFTPLIAEGGDE